MRIAILLVCASLAACGSSPTRIAPAVAHAPPKPSRAPVVSASEPIDSRAEITDVTAPRAACVVAGRALDGFDLSGRSDGPSLFHVGPGDAKLIVANEVTFAEVVTPTVTLRGFVSQNPKQRRAFVYAKKWLSFGGVYFPGIRTPLHVFGEHDGKLVLDAPDLTPLTLTQKNRWVEVECADVSLTPDPTGRQRTELPPAFSPPSTTPMILEGLEPIAISAEAHGEAVGEIRFERRPWNDGKAKVLVLETSGDRTRIRWDHLAGWVPTARLSKPSPKTLKMAEYMDAPGTSFHDSGERVFPDYRRLETTLLTCTENVPVAATSDQDEGWFVMGTIPAGQPVRVSSMNEIFSLLKLDGASLSMSELFGPPRAWAGTWNVELAHCQGALETSLANAGPSALEFANEVLLHAILNDTVDALTPQVRRSGAVSPPKEFPKQDPPSSRAGSYTMHLGPSVMEHEAHTTGPLSTDLVARVTRQSFPELDMCPRHAARVNHGLSGEIKLRFEIDSGGHVSSIADTGSIGPSLEAIGCVARGISRILFPAPKTAKEVVDYSMYF